MGSGSGSRPWYGMAVVIQNRTMPRPTGLPPLTVVGIGLPQSMIRWLDRQAAATYTSRPAVLRKLIARAMHEEASS